MGKDGFTAATFAGRGSLAKLKTLSTLSWALTLEQLAILHLDWNQKSYFGDFLHIYI